MMKLKASIVDKIEIYDHNKINLIASLADKNKFQATLDNLKSLSKMGFGIFYL